ncbi:hypothetical protein DSM112329_05459 [Paraconexibacter sp. AEG42_29]|uniref:HTH luxR-type domain-containing protein n=1 Tax=Paraconexibacter sp. AEG42_29 TaxID=2997339 RepID=A0AAU7B3U0_9ACTN
MGDQRPPTGLLDREGPRRLLGDAFAGALDGRGSVVVVRGPAGIGKTALLTEARADAEEQGLRVLGARGAELERSFTFGVVRTLLEPPVRAATADEQASLLGGAAAPAAVALGLDTTSAVDASPVLFHALYWVVAGLCDRAPVALFVDDVHWSDAPSLRTLAFVANRARDHPLVLVLGIRDGAPCDDEPALDAIVDRALVIRLAGLSREAVALLLAEGTGEQPGPEAAAALQVATSGNPMFVLQAARMSREQVMEDPDEPWSVRAVSMVALARIGGLSRDAAAVAAAVAVLGDDVPPVHVTRFTQLDIAAVLTAADELAAAGLFDAGTRLALSHPLIAEALRGDGGPRALALAHHRAATILREAAAPPERVASHLLRTIPAGDPEIAALLVAAAEDADRRGAPAAAITYLTRALDEPPAPDVAAAVRQQLGVAQFRVGQLAEAVENLSGVSHDTTARLRTVATYATAAGFGGQRRAMVEVLHDAADHATDDADRRLALRSLAHYWSWWLPPNERRPFDLPPPAELSAETTAGRLALAAHTTFHTAIATREESVDIAIRALADGQLAWEAPSFAGLAANPLDVLLMAGHLEEFDRELAHVEAVARSTASGSAMHQAEIMRLASQVQAGDLPAALETVASMDRFVAASPGSEGKHVGRMAFAYRLETVLAHQGAEAADALMATEVDPRERAGAGELVAMWGFPSWALVHLACHRAPEALAAAREHRAFVERHEGHVLPVSWEGALPLALSAAGEAAEALAEAQKWLAEERRFGVPARIAAALRILARVDPSRSIALLEEALALHDSAGFMRLEHARAHIDLGVALRRAGRRTDARGALERGADLATACQAGPLAGRAREELVALGARPRKLAFSGVDSLTASERRIVDLVVAGHTNRQVAEELFVTIKTVEAHLGNAYRKLDVRSRADLRAILAPA